MSVAGHRTIGTQHSAAGKAVTGLIGLPAAAVFVVTFMRLAGRIGDLASFD